jgi:putative DNA primase/helicase
MAEQNPSQANQTSGEANSQSQGNGQSQPQGNGQGAPLSLPSPTTSPQPQQASPSSPGPQPTPIGAPTRLPIIRLIPGDLPVVVNEAEAALIAAGGRNIYKRGDALVRPTRVRIPTAGGRKTYSWQMVNVSKAMMVEELTTVARFEKITKGGKVTNKDCPDYVAETYLARIGRWKLPDLVGIISTPFFRSDGSLCQKPGYDPASALVYMPSGTTFPPVPSRPTKTDAQAALKRLKEALFTEFPFIENVDRAVALSALFTTLGRSSIDTAPLHSFSAPSPGTGKSYLIDVIAILATGYLAPVISQGQTDEEFEKRIDACLIAGDQIVSIDNCHRPLDSDKLCQALTQPQLRIRNLGYSRNISVPVVSLFFANGK